MSKQSVTPGSSEIIQIKQQRLLENFLKSVRQSVKDQAALHLPQTVDETERKVIISPQVFISYAWETNESKLTHLQTLLKRLSNDLTLAGLMPWLDLQRMTGELEKQMRLRIKASQYVLLIGTKRYAERTKPDCDTNVRKELTFALTESKKSEDFLLPLMLEGDYDTTFPALGQYLIRDVRSWYSLERDQWQSYEDYINALTQCEPLGILPCLLGLNRNEDYPKYRKKCLQNYKSHYESLMAQLKLLKQSEDKIPEPGTASNPTRLMPPPVDQKALGQLLQWVVEGEQDKAEGLIQKNKKLLLSPGKITDLSGREFKQITAFQYALWALDWHMWKMILQYLPGDEAAKQFKELELKGTAHGKHFSLQPLINALQTYVDKAGRVWHYDKQAENQWKKGIGGEQKLLPAHVINEYCRLDRPFKPSPHFTEDSLPRTRVCYVHDGSRWVEGDWFTLKHSGGGVGENFAFYREAGSRAGGIVGYGDPDRTRVGSCLDVVHMDPDLNAILALSKTRIQQLELLSSQLKLSSLTIAMG